LSGQFFISLLNPGICLLLAGAFLLLWLYRRDQIYVATAALGYAVAAVAFVIQDMVPALPMELQRIPSNFGFLLAGCLISGAIVGHYHVAVSWRFMAVVSAISAACFLWFLLVQPVIVARIYSISLALGVIALVIPVKLRPVPKRHIVDHILFWFGIVWALNYTLRPLLVLGVTGSIANYSGFQQSVYWTTVLFTQAIFSVLAAITLMVAVAIDLMAELRQQADGDELSGLLNRRGFEAAAGAAVRGCDGDDRPAALLIADLDHFKAINDTHGHAAGDAIIAAFGAHIRRLGPAAMIAGRIGGEEFAILLPGEGIESARQLAEAIRTGMAAGCVSGGVAPTASIGLAVGTPGAGLSRLMRDADQALYEAKRAGRDRVRAFTPAPVPASRAANGA
jgi:diguanylate cyclase (GGDEF)-like protein